MTSAELSTQSAARLARLRSATQEAATRWQALHEAPDPTHYVRRESMERALETLQRSVHNGATRLAVTGPPGLGKTLLLRLFEQTDDRDLHILYVPFASLEPVDFARWILAREGRLDGAGSSGSERTLFDAWADEARQGRRTVLLIDEAQSLDPASAEQLSRWIDRAGGTLVAVLAGIAGERCERVLRSSGAPLIRVVLDTPVAEAELPNFVHTLVEGLNLSPQRRETVENLVTRELWRRTEGNPRLVKSELLRAMRDPEPARPKPVPRPARRKPSDVPPPRATKPPPRPARSPASLPTPPVGEPAIAGRARPTGRRSRPPRDSRKPQARRIWGWAGIGLIFAIVAAGWSMSTTRSRPSAIPDVVPIPAPVAAVVSDSEPRRDAPAPGPPAGMPASSNSAVPETSPFAPPLGLTALAARPRPVSVSINATPWAQISVDGVPVGETPLGNLSLGAGLREFRAEFPDGRVVERELEVRDGARILFP